MSNYYYNNDDNNSEIQPIEISELHWLDYPDTKQIPNGYGFKTIPEATPENMVVMMNKINELTNVVNELLKITNGIRHINVKDNS